MKPTNAVGRFGSRDAACCFAGRAVGAARIVRPLIVLACYERDSGELADKSEVEVEQFTQ